MSVIEKVRARRQKLADVLDSEEYSGIRLIVEELYPDQAHFLFELLQNAQDTRATEARFDLQRDQLVFEHNGRPFSERDIEGITNIGKGTKATDDDSIGRFGVGFKAVFAYSETPKIYSPTFSFIIESLVLPREIEARPNLNERTVFEFPFNNPKKAAATAFAEIAEALVGLSETSLLFLSSLESISWSIEGKGTGEILRFLHAANHIEILHQASREPARSHHFLRFDEPVHGLPSQSVAVAFPLRFLADVSDFNKAQPLNRQMRIIPAEIGQVSVFFPAEKESSGLRFHLHAPFVPELSRASVKETPANKPLFEQLAHLSARSLYEIRDFGLLNAETLGVFPNLQDSLPKRYTCIRDAIIREFNEEPLTPTYDRSHAPARTLFQSKASVKEVFSDQDLNILAGDETSTSKWAASAPQKNSNSDRMIASLAIRDWDIDDLVATLNEIEASYPWQSPNLVVKGWLEAKPIEWLQRFYSLLHRELSEDGGAYALMDCPIVKLQDGSFGKGKGSYFPSDIGDDDGFRRVDPGIYQSGKSKPHQIAARKLLEEVGVREVDEKELVRAILSERYSKNSLDPRNGDLHRFMKLVEAEPSSAAIFRDHFIFEIADGHWAKPGSVFLDAPFVSTGLKSYYGTDCKGEPYPLAERYAAERISHSRFAKFATAVGAKTQLDIKQTNCYSNPQWNYLRAVGGERSTSPANQDYRLEGFEEAISSPDIQLSKLIWDTLNTKTVAGRYLWAVYRKNVSSGSRKAPSQLIHQLKSSAWVPQQDGSFVKPAEARADQLPAGFAYDVGKDWLKSVEFGSEVEKRSEAARKRKAVAVELGFESDEALAAAQWFVSLDSEERQKIKDQFENQANFDLPESESGNPERRATKVREQAETDVAKTTEIRNRSVQVGLNEVKVEAEQYLRRQYTNSDGDTICQVCKSPLPFKLEDGRYYLEKVELVRSLSKRHPQNYIAMCPNHAAMYQHAHGSSNMIAELIQQSEDSYVEVILAGNDETLYFTKTHLDDVRALLDAHCQSDANAEQD